MAIDGHLTETELARRWDLSPRTLQRWRHTGRGPAYVKLGGRILYAIADIEHHENYCRIDPHARIVQDKG